MSDFRSRRGYRAIVLAQEDLGPTLNCGIACYPPEDDITGSLATGRQSKASIWRCGRLFVNEPTMLTISPVLGLRLSNRGYHPIGSSTEFLEVALLDKSLDVTLADIKLAVLGQIDSTKCTLVKGLASLHPSQPLPVFCLNLPSIFEHSNVDEQVFWRLQTSSEIDVRPLPFIGSQQVSIQPNVFFLLWAETALATLGFGCCVHSSLVLCRGFVAEKINTFPAEFLKLVCSNAMVGQ